MNGDVALCQDRHSGYPAIGGEAVGVDVQECSPADLHTLPKRALDELFIVQVAGTMKIYDQVTAGVFFAFNADEVVRGFGLGTSVFAVANSRVLRAGIISH